MTDVYHGVEIRDDYQWLEVRHDPEVVAWTEAQTAFALGELDRLPGVDELRRRVAALETSQSPDWHTVVRVGDMLFALEHDPTRQQQPRLVCMGLDADPSASHVVVDPNALDPSGSISIDFYVPSPDGRLVAVSLSRGGTERGSVHVYVATQHPDLARAIVFHVGIYDMLRLERTPNGGFNVTEYGSVTDPEQFRALLAYSPYHRVEDGMAYPAILLLTGENDPRVDSWHSKKMAARLQAASPGSRVLLVARPGSGHGLQRSLQHAIDDAVAELSFLFHELGVG